MRLSLWSLRWDHPRMRGEKTLASVSGGSWLGSPPHARGKELSIGLYSKFIGITPACAGKSAIHYICSMDTKDHPRMRGEKLIRSNNQSTTWGSPPHARGKGLALVQAGHIVGITPACAGKSVHILRLLETGGDHPRMRGEKRPSSGRCRRSWGSPPHARGKVELEMMCNYDLGITPACAGKSRSS